jgi:hypothetical protein
MPTSVRMSPLLKRIKRAIEAEGSYSIFSEQCSVEQVVFAFANAIGRDVSELLAEWAGRSKPKPSKRTLPLPSVEDDDVMPNDNDDDSPPEQSPTILCPQCGGTGRSKTGERCSMCGATGRVRAPIDDDDLDQIDDNDDDWDDKKQSLRYEYVEEE